MVKADNSGGVVEVEMAVVEKTQVKWRRWWQ